MSAAERVRAYLENQAQMANLDHEHLHGIHRAGERHDLLASDLWELVKVAEKRFKHGCVVCGGPVKFYGDSKYCQTLSCGWSGSK